MDNAPPAPDARPRLVALDGLRLLAALAVAWFHFGVSWKIDGHSLPERHLPVGSDIAVYGFLGVEFFFMISGFVICLSSWGRRLGDFFVSRVSRLYPAYWVCVLLTAAVLVLVPIRGGLPVEGAPKPTHVLTNLTMLQQPLGVTSVDPVYWTLFAELRFYLLFALLVCWGLTYRRAVLFCAVWLTAAVFTPQLRSPGLDLAVQPEFAPYFVAGITLYLVHRFGGNPLLYGILGLTWLICLQRISVRIAPPLPGFPMPRVWPALVVITLMFVVLLLVATGRAARINWRWLTVAGALTYPFYLLHQRIGYTIMRTAYERTAVPVWALIAMTMVLMLGVAWLVHRYAERPLGALLRRAVGRGVDAVRSGDALARQPEPSRQRSGHPDRSDGTGEPTRRDAVPAHS